MNIARFGPVLTRLFARCPGPKPVATVLHKSLHWTARPRPTCLKLHSFRYPTYKSWLKTRCPCYCIKKWGKYSVLFFTNLYLYMYKHPSIQGPEYCFPEIAEIFTLHKSNWQNMPCRIRCNLNRVWFATSERDWYISPMPRNGTDGLVQKARMRLVWSRPDQSARTVGMSNR